MKKQSKKLALSRMTLRDLENLQGVAGGGSGATCWPLNCACTFDESSCKVCREPFYDNTISVCKNDC